MCIGKREHFHSQILQWPTDEDNDSHESNIDRTLEKMCLNPNYRIIKNYSIYQWTSGNIASCISFTSNEWILGAD